LTYKNNIYIQKLLEQSETSKAGTKQIGRQNDLEMQQLKRVSYVSSSELACAWQTNIIHTSVEFLLPTGSLLVVASLKPALNQSITHFCAAKISNQREV
jgi:hypothetical protein